MLEPIRFIHTADLHLGSTVYLPGDLPRRLQTTGRQAVYRAFERIVEASLSHRVDFLLIAGDVFDQKQRSIRALNFFREQCLRLEEEDIPVYAITGNHDPFSRNSRLLALPDNVHFFGTEEVETAGVYRDNRLVARVMGQSYRGQADSRKMYSYYTVPDRGLWNIGLLHTQLDPRNNRYVPCSLSDLQQKDELDYWALGHIHQPRLLQPESPVITYPGIPQGRDIGEVGPGGCLLVELQPDSIPDLSFLPVSPLVWQQVELSIENQDPPPGNMDELERLLVDRAETLLEAGVEYPGEFPVVTPEGGSPVEGFLIRWLIRGQGELCEVLEDREEEAVSYLEQRLRNILQSRSPFIWTEAVELQLSRPLPELDWLKEHSQLIREVEQVVRLCQEDEGFAEQLLQEFGEIWDQQADHEQFQEDRFRLSEREYKEILAQARDMVVARIWQERSE